MAEAKVKEKKKEDPLGKPLVKYTLIYESFQENIERFYFWLYQFLKDLGYTVEKIEDAFMSSEASAYWGVIEQRKGVAQDKAAQYMITIGNLLRNVHQIVRDLKIMDERLDYYKGIQKGDHNSDIALKSIWVDLVEGGIKSTTSVTGLAQQVGFITLPDLFYSTFIKEEKEIDKAVARLSDNETVKNILRRKLTQYVKWMTNTEKEIKFRRELTLRTLQQYYHTIKLYMGWIKPYLKSIHQLQQGDTINNPELIRSSEGAVIDLELLGYKDKEKGKDLKKYHPIVRIKIHYRTKPALMFNQEYQKGALHVGRSEMTFEAFAATKKKINEYKTFKELEDLELLTTIDASLELIKDEFPKYLEMEKKEEEKEEKKQEDFFKTIRKALEFKGAKKNVADFKKSLTFRKKKEGSIPEKDTWKEKNEQDAMKKAAKKNTKKAYDTVKKVFGMFAH